MTMEAFCTQNSQLLDEGTSKLLSLLNEMALVREDCSNLQMEIATLDDPKLKYHVSETESAMKKMESHISTIALPDTELKIKNSMAEVESEVKEMEDLIKVFMPNEKGTDQIHELECHEASGKADNGLTMNGRASQIDQIAANHQDQPSATSEPS